MGKYGDTAIKATNLITNAKVNPIQAWEMASIEIFGKGTSSQEKGCPKCSFLGLCEEGLIKNIPKDSYTKSKKNKYYAVKAVKILKQSPELIDNQISLWEKIPGNKNKKYNSQLDVVVSLWKYNYLHI